MLCTLAGSSKASYRVTMRILVIGGTGFIGAFVVRHLAEAGHDMAVLHRGVTALTIPAVREIRGSRDQLAAHVPEVVRFSPDIVIDMVLSSGRQAAAAVEALAGRTGRFVVVSSQDVYRATAVLHNLEPGPPEPVPLTEESALRTRLHTYPPPAIAALKHVFTWLDDEYDKIPVERAAVADTRLPATIVRLPMVYGPGDPLHRLLPIVKRIDDGRQVILVEDRMAGWRATRGYVEDVAAAIALAATSSKGANRVFNVGEPVPHTELAWTEHVARAAGFGGSVRTVPSHLAPAHLQPPGNVDQQWVTSTDLIRQVLGFRERIPFDVALDRTIEWERTHPPRQIDAAQYDYAAEDRALLSLERSEPA
jgi:nucleoside-diphosphate-sugar epimerase